MDAIQVYALLNKKIKGLASGVQSATVNGTTITFKMNNGSTQTMTFPQPEDGISVVSMSIDADNHLICTMSDNSTIDAGVIPTVSGDVETLVETKVDEKIDEKLADAVADEVANQLAQNDDIDSLW